MLNNAKLWIMIVFLPVFYTDRRIPLFIQSNKDIGSKNILKFGVSWKKSYLCLQFYEYGESKHCYLCVGKWHKL